MGKRQDYEGERPARFYAAERWTRSAHARRTARREQTILEAYLERCAPIESILDVPCGAGRFQPALRASGARLIAADLALGMLQQGTAADVFRLQASALSLPIAARSFELVFCFRLFHHLAHDEERQSLLRELARVSRRWVICSYFDYGSLQAWRNRVRRRKLRRHPISNAQFETMARSANLVIEQRRWLVRGISEQVVALMRRDDEIQPPHHEE